MFDGGGGAGLTGALTAVEKKPNQYVSKTSFIRWQWERLPHHLTIEFSATLVKIINSM
jgi:hypothetical protein